MRYIFRDTFAVVRKNQCCENVRALISTAHRNSERGQTKIQSVWFSDVRRSKSPEVTDDNRARGRQNTQLRTGEAAIPEYELTGHWQATWQFLQKNRKFGMKT